MTEIDPDRLYASLAALGEIGAYRDERSGLMGVNRLALTAADGAGRRHVIERMKALGLSVTVDRIGNVYARREGQRPELSDGQHQIPLEAIVARDIRFPIR